MSARNRKSQNRPSKRTSSRVDPLLDEKSQPLSVPIKGKIRPKIETHFLDTAAATYACDTTGTVTALNLIAEGTDNVNRLGRKAMMRSVSVKGFVQVPINAAAAQTAQQARILLVWDNAANGALPLITDVLTATNSVSFPNANNVARFTVLHDQVYSLGVYNTTATQSVAAQVVAPVDITKRINAPTEYLGTAATIASLQNGTVLLLTMGSIAAGATALSTVLGARVTFTDVL